MIRFKLRISPTLIVGIIAVKGKKLIHRDRGFNSLDPKTQKAQRMVERISARLMPMFGYDTQHDEWESPGRRLFFEILHTGLTDRFNRDLALRNTDSSSDRNMIRNATDYFEGDIFESEICGVDSEWVRRVIKEEEAR